MNNTYEENAKVFKAFCDENRLIILEMLQSGEKCACKILEKMRIVQSTLSHHMKILVESGIVSARKEGKWTHYSLSETGTQYAKELLTKLTKLTESIELTKSAESVEVTKLTAITTSCECEGDCKCK